MSDSVNHERMVREAVAHLLALVFVASERHILLGVLF